MLQVLFTSKSHFLFCSQNKGSEFLSFMMLLLLDAATRDLVTPDVATCDVVSPWMLLLRDVATPRCWYFAMLVLLDVVPP